MIKKVIFKNFYSFLEETEVSFEVNKNPPVSNYDVDIDGERLNKVVAVLGANGSGKTQLLRPLAFLSWFISESFSESAPDEKISYKPHKLSHDDETTFVLEFVMDNTAYKYELSVTTSKIIQESLYVKTSRLYSYIFQREWADNEYVFKQKNFGLNRKLGKALKSNASAISAANILGSEFANKLVNHFRLFMFNIDVLGRQHYDHIALFESADYFQKNQNYKEKVNDLICQMDLGLSDVRIHEVRPSEDEKDKLKAFLPYGVHKFKNKTFELSFFEESSGTQSAYVMLRRIIPVLENGGIAIIDELDNDLHGHMLLKLVELFRDKHTNPHNAQLIFSCHTHEVLNVLRKHQIYLTEKRNLTSEAWRLDEVKGLRADDNLYAKYHAGALGAVPEL